ncbi:uncharacterized protein [Chelonus insularis]|uniref:uncharacterized protein n=1 Tax=Chelonus insularis TaxID=460826 RepID=UPI00158BDD0A|nr:uncharacterized protein LOC118064883 [Chelonus insularis]
MTFYNNPASIESDCDTRGRNPQRYQMEMLSRIFLWIIFINLKVVLGIPTTEGPLNVPTNLYSNTIENTDSTSPSSTISNIDEHLSRTTIPSDNATNSVIFVNTPQNTETVLGSSVLLECRTAHPVVDCQWSWQPLPPVNLPLPDINPQLNSNETTAEIATVSPATMAQALPLKPFPAFGNNSNDCSVRFTQTNYKQIGYWTCAARTSHNDSFTSTSPAMLNIANDKPEPTITFLKTDETQEAALESSSEIICKTETPVKECQWSWRLFNQTEVWNIEKRKFPAFGDNNTDCSIKFKNVLRQHEGLWTCGVRTDLNSSFIQAKPVWFFVSEVEFIQLSQGIKTAAGEPALLKCLVNKPVVQCEWTWKPLNSSKEPIIEKNFVPNDNNKHDCSRRLENVVYEEEGIWTCRVRLTHSGRVHEAAPATLTLLPSAKISFVEIPENKSVVIASPEALACTTNNRIEKCSWLWHSLDDTKVVVKYEFPGTGNLGRNCTLYFPQIRFEDQGYWACQVSIPSTNVIHTSAFAKVIVYNQEKIEFSELLQNIQIYSGESVFLRCITSSAVEQCRWSLTPVNSNITVVISQFTPDGSAGRNCSARLSHALAEQEGLWTCSVKAYGAETYINAPPTKLSLLEPEPVVVTIFGNLNEKISMGCRINPLPLDTKCRWFHKTNQKRTMNDTIKLRQNVQLNYTSGICTLQFKPNMNDLGLWICQFVLEINGSSYQLGNGTVNLFIRSKDDEKLGWIVGAVTTLILFLMILVVVLVVCKTKFFTSKSSRIFETAPIKTTVSNNRNKNTNNSSRTVESRLSDGSSLHSISGISSNDAYRNSEFYGNMDRGRNQTSSVYERFNVS